MRSRSELPSPPEDEATGIEGLIARNRRLVAAGQARVNAALEKNRDRPLVEMGILLYERDRESAGAVVSSALAFRLFLFQVPLVVLLVGIAGFMGNVIDEEHVTGVGITGTLATNIGDALSQPNATARWVAVITGLIGVVFAGRTLSRVLVAASCLAWRLPMSSKASIRATAAIVGLLVATVGATIVVNRLRVDHGIAVGGISLAVVALVYAVVWLIMSLVLPRATDDPGAVLPGTVLMATTMTGVQAVSSLLLPSRISQASQLYGAIGLAIVALSWYFIGSRAMVLSMSLNAVIYERHGRVTRFAFSLPGLRWLARRSAGVRRFFDLEE